MGKYAPDNEASPAELELLEAAAAGDVRHVQAILDAGTNVNAGDHRVFPWNVTALMYAAERGHSAVVHTLLKAGALVSIQDEAPPGEGGGATVLHYAAAEGHTDIVEMLLAAGSKINAKSKGGYGTPLGIAAGNGDAKLVELLLRAGANPNQSSGEKATPLNFAAKEGHNLVVETLLAAGASVDHQDILGETPLSNAAYKGHVDVVRCLFSARANPNLAARDGTTALIWAVLGEHSDVVTQLLDNGAEIKACDSDEMTALDFAVRDKLKGIAGLLRRAGGLTGEELGQLRKAALAKKLDKAETSPNGIETAEFVLAIRALAEAANTEPVRSPEIVGAVFFKLPEGQIKVLVQQFHEPFLKQDMYVFGTKRYLGLYPTADKYEVIKAIGTNGCNYDLSTQDIIGRLRALEKEQPFVLTGIDTDFVSGRFTSPIKNSKKLAKQLYEFCPDMVDQGAGTVANAALELKRSNQLFLWWD